MNDYLTGSNATCTRCSARTLDGLAGKTIKGNSLMLTIDPHAPAAAPTRAGGSNCGAAVALEPPRARVLAMATSPALRRQPGRAELPADRPPRRRVLAGSSAPQPRHRRPLRAGLDVQARHGRRRARHGDVTPARSSRTAATAPNTASRSTTSPPSGPERSARVTLRASAPALDQRRLLRGRQAARGA